LVKKLTPIHHNLKADFEKLQAHLKELEARLEETNSALREAQTEAWTKKHVNEEVSRALEQSKQMHKEANEYAAISAEKFEKLETRYKISQKVTERMLADFWLENASKNERIRILATNPTHDELTQQLDDRQVKLHAAESQVVETQRLVETLHIQLTDAKADHTELQIENRNLECQIGEAKVRLYHDYEDEERLRAELERANTDVEEFRQSSEGWQHVAVSKLDEYAPEVIAEVKEITLQTLQDKVDEAASRIQALAEDNNALEIDLDDLQYELGINKRRLATDESVKIGFYERHWSTVQEIFDENQSKTAMIKGFPIRQSFPIGTSASSPLPIAEEIVRVAQSFLDGWSSLGEKEATEGLSKGRSAKCQARPVSRDRNIVIRSMKLN
jgi:regulator of replication initiation timing